MVVTLQALKPYAYAGRSLSVGDIFEASISDAHLLTLIGMAVERVKDSPALPKRGRYRRRDLRADES